MGEFAVVRLALDDGLELNPSGSGTETWIAYSTYVVGYTLFGVLMAIFLVCSQEDHDAREMLYSLGGLVAKLGLLVSEYAAHKHYPGLAIGTLVLEILVCLFLTVLAFPSKYKSFGKLVFGD